MSYYKFRDFFFKTQLLKSEGKTYSGRKNNIYRKYVE